MGVDASVEIRLHNKPSKSVNSKNANLKSVKFEFTGRTFRLPTQSSKKVTQAFVRLGKELSKGDEEYQMSAYFQEDFVGLQKSFLQFEKGLVTKEEEHYIDDDDYRYGNGDKELLQKIKGDYTPDWYLKPVGNLKLEYKLVLENTQNWVHLSGFTRMERQQIALCLLPLTGT